MKEIILATNNESKLKEIQAILAPIHCIPQASLNIPPAVETALSFLENALIKARWASDYAHKPALADDSGLVVPALDGAPGIYSARFAGANASDAENNELLLEKMHDLKGNEREAYFYCAMALVKNATCPCPIIATGLIKGRITSKAQGLGGFGYDPLFYCEDYQCTLAELPAATKNAISHRAKALQRLFLLLQE